MVFGRRELFVLVLHSPGPDSYLTHFDFSVSFEGRELCVLVLHSAVPDSHFTIR